MRAAAVDIGMPCFCGPRASARLSVQELGPNTDLLSFSHPPLPHSASMSLTHESVQALFAPLASPATAPQFFGTSVSPAVVWTWGAPGSKHLLAGRYEGLGAFLEGTFGGIVAMMAGAYLVLRPLVPCTQACLLSTRAAGSPSAWLRASRRHSDAAHAQQRTKLTHFSAQTRRTAGHHGREHPRRRRPRRGRAAHAGPDQGRQAARRPLALARQGRGGSRHRGDELHRQCGTGGGR